MTVVRDFIPEGEKGTPSESALRGRTFVQKDGVVQDFVPADGVSRGAGDPKVNFRVSQEAARRASAGATLKAVGRAKEFLLRQPGGFARDVMRSMSPHDRDVYLVVEKETLNRSEIVDFFPKPDPRIVERIGAFMESEKRASAREGCAADTKAGDPCKNSPVEGSEFCRAHRPGDEE